MLVDEGELVDVGEHASKNISDFMWFEKHKQDLLLQLKRVQIYLHQILIQYRSRNST